MDREIGPITEHIPEYDFGHGISLDFGGLEIRTLKEAIKEFNGGFYKILVTPFDNFELN